jgi:DNA processing protein
MDSQAKIEAGLPNLTVMNADSTQFPPQLRAIPSLNRSSRSLHFAGNLSLLELPAVGFCGSRKSSEKGMEAVRDCCEQAARSRIVVVSGNAKGIDFAAHFTALAAGGSTILVLPEGIRNFRVRKDMRTVWDWGKALVVSQFEPDASWTVFRAMERNDLIIGLSRAMVVVEAGEAGGTVSAGKATLKAGKPLYVAVYENMPVNAPGNDLLLQLGGKRLSRSRASGRANLGGLFGEVSVPQLAQKAIDPQLALL